MQWNHLQVNATKNEGQCIWVRCHNKDVQIQFVVHTNMMRQITTQHNLTIKLDKSPATTLFDPHWQNIWKKESTIPLGVYTAHHFPLSRLQPSEERRNNEILFSAGGCAFQFA